MLQKALATFFFVFMAGALNAQTTYLQLNTEDYYVLDRIETRSGALTNNFFTSIKPIPRKGAVEFLIEQKEHADSLNLSSIDRYNVDHAISVSGEWTPDEDGAIDSRRPWFNTFYKKQPDFFHVKTNNFFLAVNPVISAQLMSESNTIRSDRKFWSSRGLELRGWVAKKIGFYTYLTDNQERVPDFVDAWIAKHRAVPGADFFTRGTVDHYDYFLARGYVDVAAIKDHLNVIFGYDKHFLGDGMRSLQLSDFSTGATFLRLNTRIWKLNYQNLFLELTPQFTKTGSDDLLPHKYATIHTLSVNATKWLNIGIYESVIFGRRNRFEFSYMLPIIFYRAIERGLGSPDNVNLGINFKAIALRHVQLYGQLMLDEFKAKELFGGRGWWANKYGIQLGGKYFDAVGVRNLDLQAEINMVRPYTYTHYDSIANYTHYNQPLAHPLGAGFREIIGLIRYQPVKNLFVSVKGMYYQQGADTGASNYGSNIFKIYTTRSSEFNVGMINGVKTTGMLMNLNFSYELRENLFIDLGASHREFSFENDIAPKHVTNYFYGGFRLNIARRDYDFY